MEGVGRVKLVPTQFDRFLFFGPKKSAEINSKNFLYQPRSTTINSVFLAARLTASISQAMCEMSDRTCWQRSQCVWLFYSGYSGFFNRLIISLKSLTCCFKYSISVFCCSITKWAFSNSCWYSVCSVGEELTCQLSHF